MSDDERQIPAHKLVLSACSDFFKSILRNNSHSHPLLYLSGIHSTNLSLILDYIYQGEVQIYQEHLDSFLEVAQKLKIEGLINATDGEDSNIKPENLHDNLTKPEVVTDNIEVFGLVEKVENEVGKISRPERRVTVNNYSGAEETIQKNLVREVGGYSCKICNFSRKLKIDVTRHIETHIEGLSYSCSVCEKTFRSSNSLRNHKSHFHKF